MAYYIAISVFASAWLIATCRPSKTLWLELYPQFFPSFKALPDPARRPHKPQQTLTTNLKAQDPNH